MYTLLDVCFICLKNDINLSIFFKKDDEFRIAEQVKYIFPELVIPEFESPIRICLSCHEKVRSFKEFKEMCFENISLLKNSLNVLQFGSNGLKQVSNLTDEIISIGDDPSDLSENESSCKADEKIDISDDEDENTDINSLSNLIEDDSTIECCENELIFEDEEAEIYKAVKQEVNSNLDGANFDDFSKNTEEIDCKAIPMDSKFISGPANSDFPTQNDEQRSKETNLEKNEVEEENLDDSSENIEEMDGKIVEVTSEFENFDNSNENLDEIDVKAIETTSKLIDSEPKGIKILIETIPSSQENVYELIEIREENMADDSKSPEEVDCKVCKKIISEPNLKAHFELNHPNLLGLNFECTHCCRKFSTSFSYLRHMSAHKKGDFKCTTCNKYFSRKSALKKHMEMHKESNNGIHLTGALLCRICNRRFAKKKGLSLHMYSHGHISEIKS